MPGPQLKSREKNKNKLLHETHDERDMTFAKNIECICVRDAVACTKMMVALL
jgi:hypothetical protein